MYIIIAIILFGALIAVHEFGHFITAKLCGVKVLEFAIGMGPLLWSKQGEETLYSLRLLPIGGYCAMEGEDSDSDDPRSFSAQHPLKKEILGQAVFTGYWGEDGFLLGGTYLATVGSTLDIYTKYASCTITITAIEEKS